MQISQSDLELETIFSRIKRKDIDLQPDFQRGDVWTRSKKRKLIDSILRGWKIPPVHVIEDRENSIWYVLDGQQRLTSIKDFIDNKFPVDGYVIPLDPDIAQLDKIYFSELPDVWRRKIFSYEVRFIRIKEYRPEEPAELFYRLNQPTILTAAEQRNAFYGKSRDQIKHLVEKLTIATGGKSSLGFSNSRLAYDDVIAKLCIFLESRSIWNNVNSNTLTEKYRDIEGFDTIALKKAEEAIDMLADTLKIIGKPVRFTKASLLSWLYFIASLRNYKKIPENEKIAKIIYLFEKERLEYRSVKEGSITIEKYIFQLYNERLSYRVSEPISVAERDVVIWMFFYLNSDKKSFRDLYAERYGILSAAVDSFNNGGWEEFNKVFSVEKWGSIQ